MKREKATQRRLEQLAAEERGIKAEREAHQKQVEAANLQLRKEQKNLPQPETPSPHHNSKNWERICPVYKDTKDIEEFAEL